MTWYQHVRQVFDSFADHDLNRKKILYGLVHYFLSPFDPSHVMIIYLCCEETVSLFTI